MTFEHKPHARTLAILEHRVHPTKSHDQLPQGDLYAQGQQLAGDQDHPRGRGA